jgi:hypothetical protein
MENNSVNLRQPSLPKNGGSSRVLVELSTGMYHLSTLNSL